MAGRADHVSARRLDRLYALARGQSGRDDVLDHGHARAGRNLEGAAEREDPALALDVERRDAQVARGLIAGDDAADRRRDANVHLADLGADLRGQGAAQALAPVGVHEHQVLLQEDGAVQAGG